MKKYSKSKTICLDKDKVRKYYNRIPSYNDDNHTVNGLEHVANILYRYVTENNITTGTLATLNIDNMSIKDQKNFLTNRLKPRVKPDETFIKVLGKLLENDEDYFATDEETVASQKCKMIMAIINKMNSIQSIEHSDELDKKLVYVYKWLYMFISLYPISNAYEIYNDHINWNKSRKEYLNMLDLINRTINDCFDEDWIKEALLCMTKEFKYIVSVGPFDLSPIPRHSFLLKFNKRISYFYPDYDFFYDDLYKTKGNIFRLSDLTEYEVMMRNEYLELLQDKGDLDILADELKTALNVCFDVYFQKLPQ